MRRSDIARQARQPWAICHVATGAQGTAPGNNAGSLLLSSSNFVSETARGNNNAGVGYSAIYRDMATLEDGTSVWGRSIITGRSDPRLNIDISGFNGAETLLNGGSTFEQVGARRTASSSSSLWRRDRRNPDLPFPAA